MRSKGFRAIVLALILTLFITGMPSCGPIEEVEGYVAVVPKVLHSGSKEAVAGLVNLRGVKSKPAIMTGFSTVFTQSFLILFSVVVTKRRW